MRYPHHDLWSLAFQTGEVNSTIKEPLEEEEMVSFFVPTTPNPTSGFLMMAPKRDVIELEITVDQALKYIISLGVMLPNSKRPVVKK